MPPATTPQVKNTFMAFRERVLYGQPAGPNPLYHRDDSVDRPRAMEFEFPFPGSLASTVWRLKINKTFVMSIEVAFR